jgi:hypothetical protein
MGCFWKHLINAVVMLFRQFPVFGMMLQATAGAICGPPCAALASAFVAGVTSGDLGMAIKAGFISMVTSVIAQSVMGGMTSNNAAGPGFETTVTEETVYEATAQGQLPTIRVQGGNPCLNGPCAPPRIKLPPLPPPPPNSTGCLMQVCTGVNGIPTIGELKFFMELAPPVAMSFALREQDYGGAAWAAAGILPLSRVAAIAHWKKTTVWGHTFRYHGQGEQMTRRLTDTARSTGVPQGQWLNNDAAAEVLSSVRFEGNATVRVPEGLAQVIMPDGSIFPTEWAKVIVRPMPGQYLETAYPILGR